MNMNYKFLKVFILINLNIFNLYDLYIFATILKKKFHRIKNIKKNIFNIIFGLILKSYNNHIYKNLFVNLKVV